MTHKYEKIKYSRSRIKKAGKTFISKNSSKEEREQALVLINNWRAAHSFPLQIIYVHLKLTAPETAIVAQRLKRLYSITQKLYRFPNMSLTAMQDIGGCRVIVNTIDEVYDLVDKLKHSRMRHIQKEEYDYIKDPKDDGYRSFHLVLSYQSDKNTTYNGLFIEIQIRTHLQHIWATAVESVDTFTGDPLKIGRGNSEDREFFVLTSKVFEVYENAEYDIEKATNSSEGVKFRNSPIVKRKVKQLETIQKVAGFVSTKDLKKQGYYVLRLNRKTNQLIINQFKSDQLEQATEYYNNAEKSRDIDEDVVLVSTASFVNLQQAYPNYFTDISEFLQLVKEIINFKVQ